MRIDLGDDVINVQRARDVREININRFCRTVCSGDFDAKGFGAGNPGDGIVANGCDRLPKMHIGKVARRIIE